LVKWVVDAGSLALPVGVALEDEFVGGGLEPVDRGLGEERVGHEAEPLADGEVVPGVVEVDGWWSPSGRCRWGIVWRSSTTSEKERDHL
jgi:hypothetical protein